MKPAKANKKIPAAKMIRLPISIKISSMAISPKQYKTTPAAMYCDQAHAKINNDV
jgi:hypothetical protein